MSEYQQRSYSEDADMKELIFYRQRIIGLIADTVKISPKLTNKRREILEEKERSELAKLLLSGLETGSYYCDY